MKEKPRPSRFGILRCIGLICVGLAASAVFGQPVFHDRFERSGPLKDCPDCPSMVLVPAGNFVQGSPADEPESQGNERPQRTVHVPSFLLGQTEVTLDEWDACVADGGCSYNASDFGWGRGDRPVADVTWDDVQEYVVWLSAETGYQYRLPSESEWEYAARAGTTGRFNTGDCINTEQANFHGPDPAEGCPSGIARHQTLPVASFEPNAFGLYDTHGNVGEWVQDCWNESYLGAPTDGSVWAEGDCDYAVLRGGGYNFVGFGVRSASRSWWTRDFRLQGMGFRVARLVGP
jgi:serine/threonine-protein kinase